MIALKVIVNYPQSKEDIELLEDNVATFKATLILESIKKLNIPDERKKQVLKDVLNHLNNSN